MKKYFVLNPDKLIKQFSLKEFDDYSDEYYGESDSQIIFELLKEKFYTKLGLNDFEKSMCFEFYISDEENRTIRLYDIRTILNINTIKCIEICR